ncbi:YokU family protein [Bacillus sp. CGMCC 1.16541]|uniref:YokU family protein n=1 Tax=Bacillus sp. CGMCC 1.16541 TaxID=2185143 RepID=UPI000D7330C2|nr:YokU family protein [Bacillus sp. CGMCC 1.16541]
MNCEWCEAEQVNETQATVYWELPDGTKSIQIDDAPSIHCLACKMIYQQEKVVKEIEDQLFLIQTKELEKQITFKELMAKPRLLKRNYFDFSS